MFFNTSPDIALPITVDVALLTLLGLTLEALAKRRKPWQIPALIIYATTGLWYFTEIVSTPEKFVDVSSSVISTGYLQVIIFLAAFRLLVPSLTHKLINRPPIIVPSLPTPKPERLLWVLSSIWLILLLYGLSRMNWDVAQALFPLTARRGLLLFGRAGGAAAGLTGFIVSSAGYIYSLVCAFFGVLFFFQKRFTYKFANLALFLISSPFFLLSGTRNSFLAVVMPGFLTYLLVSRQKWWLKVIVSLCLYTAIDYAFSVVISYRNVGFTSFFQGLAETGQLQDVESRHLGLDMLQELFYINQFYDQGVLTLQYGRDYLVDALNVIPRAIWPEKPLLGLEYNLLRGKGGAVNDIGVSATISAGFIGRGIINFGPWLGPLAPALLMALWAALLSMLWSQRYSILRLGLFLIGLGITPNLGRDITLLVLWPFVFGYMLVLYLERREKKRIAKLYNANFANYHQL